MRLVAPLAIALAASGCAMQVTRVTIVPCRTASGESIEGAPLVIQRGASIGLASVTQAVVIPRVGSCAPADRESCIALGAHAQWDERVGCVLVSTEAPALSGEVLQ